MSRSPLSYPLNRGHDTDAGGAADLQTDVMRFMAIISLCLVAIFALVQSLPTPAATSTSPTTAAPETPVPTPAVTVQSPAAADPAPPPPEEAPDSVPKQKPPPAPTRQLTASLQKPVAKRQEVRAVPSPPATVPKPRPEPKRGFTLRFESDRALTRLVARNEIGLYAMQQGEVLRMAVNRGSVSFWPAGTPAQFHEMDESTVPDPVLQAFRRRAAAGRATWGVTLPATVTKDLNRFLNEHAGGELVIDVNGQLRLED